MGPLLSLPPPCVMVASRALPSTRRGGTSRRNAIINCLGYSFIVSFTATTSYDLSAPVFESDGTIKINKDDGSRR